MKTIKIFVLSMGLMGVLVALAGFVNLRESRALKNLLTTKKNKGFAVVELFTSEGCSSCPPADELIEKIQKENENKQIYILAFHVDYWDHQGWKDRFSNPLFSERQRQYANWLRLSTVYTPQIVVNGLKEHVGSDRAFMVKAITDGLNQETGSSLTFSGTPEGNKLLVNYEANTNEKDAELVLALVQKSGASEVRGGENSGRSLSHVQIVHQLLQVPIGDKDKRSVLLHLPKNFKQKDWELIGFEQRKTDGAIVAANRLEF